MKSKYFRPGIVLLLTSLSALLCAFIFPRSQVVMSTRSAVLSVLWNYRADHTQVTPHANDIVVIGIDDDSLKRTGLRWPWNRNIFAQFFENLGELEPKAVFLDVTLIGKSYSSTADERLANSIRECPNVLLSAYFGHDGEVVLPDKQFTHLD